MLRAAFFFLLLALIIFRVDSQRKKKGENNDKIAKDLNEAIEMAKDFQEKQSENAKAPPSPKDLEKDKIEYTKKVRCVSILSTILSVEYI